MPDRAHVVRIVAAYAKRNALTPSEFTGLIAGVNAALAGIENGGGMEPETPRLEPAVPVRRTVEPDAITCLDCGYEAKMLKRHLSTAHGLSVEAYRERWNLKPDYPVVAPAYAAKRSELAKSAGLGTHAGRRRGGQS